MKKNYQKPTVRIIETGTYELLAGTGAGGDSSSSITNPEAGPDTGFGGGGDEDPRARQAFDFFEEEDSSTLKINLNLDHLLGD